MRYGIHYCYECGEVCPPVWYDDGDRGYIEPAPCIRGCDDEDEEETSE